MISCSAMATFDNDTKKGQEYAPYIHKTAKWNTFNII